MKRLIVIALLLLFMVGCDGWDGCPRYRIVMNHDGTYTVQSTMYYFQYSDELRFDKPFNTIEQARAYIKDKKEECAKKNKRRVVG